MTNSYVDDEILKQAADSIIEDYKQSGETVTPEQEVQIRNFVAGLVDVEPPTEDQLWQSIEILTRAIEVKDREKALRAVTFFMLQFISGCEHSPEAFQCVPMLYQVKEAIKADRFHEASEFMMAFLSKSREVARGRGQGACKACKKSRHVLNYISETFFEQRDKGPQDAHRRRHKDDE